jgi:ABC-2 type transport system ATP-binding protein
VTVPTTAPAPSAPAWPGADLVVEVRDVHKRFGPVPALSNLTMLVPKGRITVLLGPNGAGKTTAIRVVTGALAPDRGHVRTFGSDPDRFGEEVRRRCGVVSAKPALYDRLSGWDNLQYSAELYGLGRNAVRPIREAAGRFGILEALDQQVGGYSTGMKTRLALARSVLHDPELLLFDEPTSGLDPESSRAVLDLIREMTADGHTVIMCTHLLIEAEGLADQIIVLDGGTDLLHGSQEELVRRYWPHDLVRFDATDRSALIDALRDLGGVLGVGVDGHGVEAQVDTVERVPDLVDGLVARGLRVTKVEPHQPTLEDLYFAVRRERRTLPDRADLPPPPLPTPPPRTT